MICVFCHYNILRYLEYELSGNTPSGVPAAETSVTTVEYDPDGALTTVNLLLSGSICCDRSSVVW